MNKLSRGWMAVLIAFGLGIQVNAEKVLVEDPVVRARRLLLCARTLLVLETGLGLLGLRTLTRM
mgnify:CR=1 FL=1